MKQTIILKSLLAAATLLGVATATQAQEPAAPVTNLGLLGQTYAGLSYSYLHLDDSPANADSYGFEYNQALNTGLDAVLTYDWTQTGLVLGERGRAQTLGAALRAFSTAYSWGKPYVEAGIGQTWVKFGGAKEKSYVLQGLVGAEFQVAPRATVTPYIQYSDAPDLQDAGEWNFGVKANYWVTSQWSVMAGLQSNDDHDTTYKIGTNFRF